MNTKFKMLLFFLSAILICTVRTHISFAAEIGMLTPTKASNSESSRPVPQNQNKSDNTISSDAVKVFVKQVQIYGQIAKPQAVFILPGSDPKVDGLKINRHFFDHIFRDVEKSTLKKDKKRQSTKNDHIQW